MTQERSNEEEINDVLRSGNALLAGSFLPGSFFFIIKKSQIQNYMMIYEMAKHPLLSSGPFPDSPIVSQNK